MRIVVQRVRSARVDVDGETVGEIGTGILALVGIGPHDDSATVARMAAKVARLRIFANPDEPARKPIDIDCAAAGGAVLAVSQFTLYADTSRGRRPSFVGAAEPELARVRFEEFCRELRGHGLPVATGRFGANMQVELVNDGPVTIVVSDEAGRNDEIFSKD